MTRLVEKIRRLNKSKKNAWGRKKAKEEDNGEGVRDHM